MKLAREFAITFAAAVLVIGAPLVAIHANPLLGLVLVLALLVVEASR